MEPGPYFPPEEHRRARTEIETAGFEADPWLERLDVPVLGLNVAMHWPLPEGMRAAYERLRERLLALGGGAHVYPHEQTHVTIATLASFKRHERPTEAVRAAILARVPKLARLVDRLAAALGAFEIDVCPPVLVRSAAFLPIRNPTGEVAELRRGLAAALAGDVDLQIPPVIHSTVLRFRNPPHDPHAFLRAFDAVAAEGGLGTGRVDQILITAETRPYMMAGQIVHRSQLRLATRG